jgi:hypothetical protein
VGDSISQLCGGCKQFLPLEMFAPSHRGAEGRWCRECFRLNARNERVAIPHAPRVCENCGETYTPKQIKAASGGDFCSKPCRRAALRKRQRVSDPEGLSKWDRDRNLKKLYGPDAPARYDAVFVEQGGACAICGTMKDKSLVFDHNHACCPKKSCGNCLRGLLCHNCNRFIGLAGDDPEVLLAAVEYILKYRVIGDPGSDPGGAP